MISQIFTVFDSKTEAYMPPFFAPTLGAAIRSFSDTVQEKDHIFNKHAEDYTLFHLGYYDDQTAIIENLKSPKSIGVAIEFLNTEQG